uniref:Uncharacterized protein n=1 Tax=Caenorhabditis japonica TaxID=281687 RepID=A0A8R1E926_CAEJA
MSGERFQQDVMAAPERRRRRQERQRQTLARNTNQCPKSHALEIRRRHRSGRQQPKAASLMIQELVEMRGKVGHRMNTNKTKVMINKFASQSPVNVTHNNVTTCIEEVNEYVYLGRLLNHNNELEPELHRRRRAAWAAFNNIKNTTDPLSSRESELNSSIPSFYRLSLKL